MNRLHRSFSFHLITALFYRLVNIISFPFWCNWKHDSTWIHCQKSNFSSEIRYLLSFQTFCRQSIIARLYHRTHVRIWQYPLIMRTFLYTRGVDDDITIFFRHSFENLFFSHSLQPDIHFCLGKTCRVAVIQIDRTDLNESTFDRSSPLRMCKVQL